MAHTPDHFDDFFKRLGRRRFVKGSWRILRYVLLILVILVIAGWFVLQNGWVQNRLMGYITDYLSEELDTRVDASRIDFDFFDKLVLEGFYVEDHRGDTLLFSRELKASFDVNLIKILKKQFDIDDIYLTDTRMRIMRDTGEQLNNVQMILRNLVKEEQKAGPKDERKLPLLSVENVYLDNITFLQDDRVKGQEIITFLDAAHISVNSLNLEKELVAVDDFVLEGPNVVLIQKEPHPLPPIVKTVKDSTVQTTEDYPEDTTNFKLLIANFQLSDGAFSLRNYRINPTPSTLHQELDFNNLTVNDIQIGLENFSMQAGVFETKIKNLQAKESSGFELSELSAEIARVGDRKIELSGLNLRTPYSLLKDKLSLNYRSYEDFKNFPEKVLIQGNFENSRIALKDIMVFAKALKNNAFFAQNADQVVEIDGKIQGRINSLKGDNVQIRLGESTFLKGSFSSRNLTRKGEEYLSFNLDNFESDMQTLRLLIPGFKPPPNFDKIGRFSFDGNFLGFFIDFVAAGNLQTELGTAKMDMRMNLRKGRELAQYAGNLALSNFDLGRWTGNTDVGMVSFESRVEEGQGLTLETVDARVGGLISQLSFKNYDYKNLSLDGTLKQNLFDGKLSIQDDNIDFTFDGSVDFTDSIPKFDFASQVNRLDIKTLNLSPQDFVLSGNTKIQLVGNNLSNIQGDLLLRNFSIIKNGLDTFRMDSLLVFSELFPDTRRSFSVGSDILDLELDGIFDIQEVPNVLIGYLEKNYGGLASRFNIKTNGNTDKDSKFKFDLALRNSANWTRLIDPQLDTLENIVASGYFDNVRDSVYLELSVPGIHYKNLYFDDILLDIEGKEDFSDVHLEVYHTKINGQDFEPIELTGELAGDTLFFEVVSTNFTSVFDDLKLNGQFFPLPEENFQISFFPSNLVIVKQTWDIASDNYIRFGKNFLETKNFDLQSGEKRISINSIGDKGLQVGLENISLGLIDDWWDFDKMNFSQTINLELSAGDVFNLKDLQLTAIADTLEINGDDWGQLSLTANLPELTASTELYTSITKGDEQLIVKGELSPFKKEGRVFNNDFDFDVSIKNYNLSIAEYFISNIISETVGKFDSGVKLNGKFSKPNINGSIRIFDASLRINYTNTRYDIPDSYTTINNQIFDVSGNYMIDSLGNRANLYGGFLHNHLKDWRMGATISSDKFLFLNTSKKINPIYYGTGIGSGSIRFSGPFQQIDIDINAKTGPGTRVVIPVSNASNAAEVKFIEYIEKNKKTDDDANNRRKTELRGVAVNMNVDMTEDADAMLVFDERAGDIMRGRGNGSIQFSVNRLGEISMYGNYDIVQGNYLFTLLNLVNKPFVVKEGGTIRWEGDPYNAIIDIEAEYGGLNTSLSNFISEYLDPVNPGELELEARKSQNVLLTMFLDGPLKQPDINFDISFPGLDGQLENVSDSKLRIIRQDQAELNRQVFGLLVIGGFLPSSNSNALAGRGDLIPINTISELLSNQLSIHLTQLLSEVFTDVGFISGVDFNINYNVYDNELSLANGVPRTTGSALQLRQSLDLFNDRLTVQVGGNIDWGSNLVETSNSAFLAGDVVIEYAVTKDRRFKVRAYQLTDAIIVGGRRNKRGIGLSWRKEFDNINEFFRNMKKDARKNLEKGSN